MCQTWPLPDDTTLLRKQPWASKNPECALQSRLNRLSNRSAVHPGNAASRIQATPLFACDSKFTCVAYRTSLWFIAGVENSRLGQSARFYGFHSLVLFYKWKAKMKVSCFVTWILSLLIGVKLVAAFML